MPTPSYTWRLSEHAYELDADGRHDLDDMTDVDLSTPPTDGQTLLWDDGDAAWKPGNLPAAGAPSTADYLVGTAQAGLSAEIVVGATPGGELGGTWASPTIDGTHSGSTHAATQAAAEATAAAALAAHVAAGSTGIGPLLLASDHAVPIVFDDILQASDGADFLYASEP